MTDLATRQSTAVNPLTGEVLDLDGPVGDLAAIIDGIGVAHRMLADFEAKVSDALLQRMDSGAAWTLHEGDYTITAPSPTAGATEYPSDALEAALWKLVEDGTISPEAAEKACERRLSLELKVPWGADHRDMAQRVKEAHSIEVAGVQVTVTRSEARSKASASGISAVKKVPGVAEVLDGAAVTKDPGRRRVTVKVKAA